MVTPTGQPRQFETMGRSVTFVPLVIKRRHRSKLIVPPVGGAAVKATSSFDLPLIRTLGKAFYWQRMIDTGEVANASELARSLKLEVGWVCEVLRMTRLAPDIIRAILDGRQPRHLICTRCVGGRGKCHWIGRSSGRCWNLRKPQMTTIRSSAGAKSGRHDVSVNQPENSPPQNPFPASDLPNNRHFREPTQDPCRSGASRPILSAQGPLAKKQGPFF